MAGVVITASLIAYHSFSAVSEAIYRVGWGFGPIIAIYFLAVFLNCLAWHILFRSERPGFIKELFVIRWIRESVNYLLPSGLLGGDIVGIRLLSARRDMDIAVAATVADKTLEMAGLFFFALTSIFILLFQGGNGGLEHWAIRGLAAIAAMLIAFLLAQRLGLLKLVDKIVLRFSGKCGVPVGANTSVHDTVWATYADRRRLFFSTLFHFLAWTPGALQIWLALRFMGHGVGWQEAFVLEGLSQVICAAAFVMPAALGAQEAAYMSIGMLFGIPPALGLAVSLVQRLKDVSVSISGLLVWQGFEGRRLWEIWKNRGGRT